MGYWCDGDPCGCCGHSLLCDKPLCHDPPFQKHLLPQGDKVHAEATLEHILPAHCTQHSFRGTVETDYTSTLRHSLHLGLCNLPRVSLLRRMGCRRTGGLRRVAHPGQWLYTHCLHSTCLLSVSALYERRKTIGKVTVFRKV